MDIYKELLQTAKLRYSENSYSIIKNAMRVAIQELEPYKRYNGDPMVNHSINTALIVINELGLGRNSVVATLLHDVVRLNLIPMDEIRKKFGSECAGVLMGLNNISAVDTNHDTSQSEHFRDLIVSYSTNPRIILIKLADRLEVMRMLHIFPEAKRTKKSWETLDIYSQLAHKLGLYQIKTQMEDLSLRYLEPADYAGITLQLERTKAWREDFIEKFIRPINERMKQTDMKYTLKGRTKSVYSIWRKMKKQRIPFDQVYDVFAIRIILDSEPIKEKADCWLSYSIVSDIYNPNTERMRDWISIPKGNGYESLHTTVVTKEGRWVEVQIRTERMDEVAERGIAAHWKYKGVSDGAADGEMWLSRLREMMEGVQFEGDNIKLDDSIGTSDKEIFVFTPNGDIRRLSRGASVLDFAFEIHSSLGSRCVGAKVNNKNVTIREKLKNGDLVEIQTSKNQKPKVDWLNLVVTSKARNRIKLYLREEQAKQAQLGREELERKIKNWKISLSIEESVNLLSKYYKVKSGLDLYGMIAQDKITMAEVKDLLTRHIGGENILRTTEVRSEKVINKQQAKDALVIDNAIGNIAYKMAKCCNPVLGDDIFAFVTVGSGITVHRVDCLNAQQLVVRYPYRVMDAKWSSSAAGGDFSAKVALVCEDTLGLEHSVRDILKELKVTLRSISMDYGKGVKAIVTVEVPSSGVLDSVVYRLGQIKGVVKSIRWK